MSYPFDEDFVANQPMIEEDDPANEVTRDNVIAAMNRGISHEPISLDYIL